MGMASYINKGDSIFIPLKNGQSFLDSNLKPRMYKTVQAFEKSFPKYCLSSGGVELVEYAEVVRCKDCKYWVEEKELGMFCGCWGGMLTSCKQDDFCSYGEKK